MNTSQAKHNCANSDLSFIIEASGEILLTIPEGNEFSPQQIRGYVAGPPEPFCRTHCGFFLFHNKEGKTRGLPKNRLATAMYLKPRQEEGYLVGRIFVAHPDHIAAYLKAE